MAVSSGDDGGDDGGDDDDGDGDDVQLDDGVDGVDFPLPEGISPADSCPPESSFLSGVLRPAEAAVTPRDYPLWLRFSGRRVSRRKGGERGCGAPTPQGGAARPWAAPPYGVGPPWVQLAPPSGFLRHLEK